MLGILVSFMKDTYFKYCINIKSRSEVFANHHHFLSHSPLIWAKKLMQT